ncbi:MAG TPA: GNVR domain-containing protein [Gemmatimonadaceae bacterium]|nr:GNVR domain-containing protein [Gemmatimonadaceae bacterium]
MTGTELTTMARGQLRGPLIRGAGRVEGPREETSLLAFLSIILAHRRVVTLCALGGMTLFGIMAAAQANRYLSRASFMVQGSHAPAQLSGAAAALGLSLSASADFGQSIVFYSDLVKAKTILVAVASRTYQTVDSKGARRPLAQIFGIKAKTPHAAAILAAGRLFPVVSSTIYSRSGMVGIAVQATDPLLAQQLATNILDEVDQYSKVRRRAQAVQERNFIEGLAGEARGRLATAEQAVSRFQVENREYRDAPQLAMENDRLQREVAMRQQIYTSLMQALDQAKIEEVRDPAAISVVETADLPADPQRTTALRKTLLGLSVGLLVGIVFAFLLQRLGERQQGRTEVFARFVATLRPSVR